jgi:hypothetical protein
MSTEKTTESSAPAVTHQVNVAVHEVTVPKERAQFRALILANPNYFGNLPSAIKPVVSIQYDTTYEAIACVGLQPQLSWLEAVVYINQSYGYNGDVCSSGSQEYVRFYLSTDNGVTWVDQGLTSFTAYDIPHTGALEYDVTLPISPTQNFCFSENLPRVRAILSWNNPPPANTPGFVPVWGNVVDARIQIAPRTFLLLSDLLTAEKVIIPQNLKSILDPSQQLAVAKPKPVPVADLHKKYQAAKVPPHRYAFTEIENVLQHPSAVQSPMVTGYKSILAMLDLNISEVLGSLEATSGDTRYEQLNCVGLDTNRNVLDGIFTVKLREGYSGGLCTAGSQEYVAFWVNWGDGAGWTYAGTASVNVHDITGIPAEGLKYAALLPADVANHRQLCQNGPKTALVRAILSWQTPPPPSDPEYIPVWGNRVDTTVNIDPGTPITTGTANISIIGGVGIGDIDVFGTGLTFSGATFALTGTPTDEWLNTRQCPFGGRIVIQGYPSVGSKYRVWVRESGSSFPTMLTDSIWTVDWKGDGTWTAPDPSGFFTYLDTMQNIDNILAYWDSSGDDVWQVWLEIADTADNVFGSTPAYNIQLDNTAPTVEIHIDSGGDCKSFPVGNGSINGHFVAQDLNFGHFSLGTSPNNPPTMPSNDPTPTTGTSETASPPGDGWNLSLKGMVPCGYVVNLNAWDLSIVGSSPYSHNYNYASVGFCLVASE